MEITVYGELESAGFPVVSSLHSASSNCLTKAMHNLLIQADCDSADLLLLVGDNKDKIWCHRCILGARSDVFLAMLSSHDGDGDLTDSLVRAATGMGPAGSKTQHGRSDSFSSSSSAPSTGQSSPQSMNSSASSFASAPPRPLTLISLPKDHNGHSACESKIYQEESKLMGDDALGSLLPASKAAFLESQTGVVVIPDCEAVVMQEFLVFLYTDALSDVNVLGIMANKLLAVSSKYQVGRGTTKPCK